MEQQIILIGGLVMGLLIALYITYVALEGISYLATVDAISDTILSTNQSLMKFLVKNKDRFYSPRSWEAITKAKNKIQKLNEHEQENKNDTVYIESLSGLKAQLKSDYENKMIHLLNKRAILDKEFIDYVNDLSIETITLSNTNKKKPLGRFFRKQYKVNYDWSVRCVEATANLLKTIGFDREAWKLRLLSVA